MSDDLPILRTRYNDAQVVRIDVVEARDTERRQRLAAVTKALDAELEIKYGARVREAFTNEHARRAEVEDEQIRLGQERLRGLNYGLLIEWDRNKNLWYTPDKHKKFPTGRKGHLEVRDRESKVPATTQYGLPELGEIFVRLRKKDGTPSLILVRLHGPDRATLPSNWLPEGEKPAQAGE